MPKQHRWVIKRHLEQATNNINRAIDDLVIAGHEFETIHPEHYQAFSMFVTNLDKIKDSIAEFEDTI
ncbi:hypothetical protein ES708_13384 [subsurface metagenome]